MTSTTPAGPTAPLLGVDGTDTTTANEAQAFAGFLQQADGAIGTRDGKGAVAALGSALSLARNDETLAPLVARLEVLAKAGVEMEAVLSLLGRAGDRVVDEDLAAAILTARANLHEKAGHH